MNYTQGMNVHNEPLTTVAMLVTVFFVFSSMAEPDPNFHCYLLFGQSNMAGGGAGVPIGGSGAGSLIEEDCDTSTRIKVLSFCDCSAGSGAACTKYNNMNRKADNWYTAYPPLHICDEGVSPGDYFAKTLLDSIREDSRIGLIPCALSGQALNVFQKGGSNFSIPTWAHPTLGNGSPYSWMLKRCKLAQEVGVIKGILLHQGESGSGGGAWDAMASGILDNLKADLGLPDTLPVVVGELRADRYADFNRNSVGKLAETYPYCGVASSEGVSVQSDDQWHFNAAGMRELGKRFAGAFLELADGSYIPRKGATIVTKQPINLHQVSNSSMGTIQVYSLDGRVVPVKFDGNVGNVMQQLKTGSVYLLSQKLNNRRTSVVPFIK